MLVRIAALLLLVTPCLLAAQKSFVIDQSKPYVYLKFDHIGARKPLSPDEPHKGLWLRLVNNCRIPIVVAIFNPGTGDPGVAVFDEVIPVGPIKGLMIPGGRPEQTESPKEKPPEGYSSEVSSTTVVTPGEDLLFSVPLNHVSPSWHMQVRFKLQLSDAGRVTQPESILAFYWQDIPETLREEVAGIGSVDPKTGNLRVTVPLAANAKPKQWSGVAQSVLLVLFVAGIYLVLPAAMVWGWVRWLKRTQPRSWPSILSLIGFALGTASGLLAISSVLYAHAIGGFPFYDPLLLRIYRWGALLSLSGTVFALIGVWRPGPLRWHAPTCAVGTLLFWFAAAMGE